MKRLVALILACLLMVGSAIAETDFEKEYFIPSLIQEGQYPAVTDGSVSLTYWMPIDTRALTYIEDNDGNAAWKLAQETTGIDYKFIHPAAGTATESFNTMMASGELPDLIQMTTENMYSGGIEKMYNDGAIVDLTPYLEEYAPQYWDEIHHDDTILRQVTCNGKVLGFYKMTFADAQPWVYANIREDWLKEFGMESPATIAEYEAYFDAILANKPGVVPLYVNFNNAEQLMPLLSAFDMLKGFYVDNGVVKNFWNADGLKEFIELMRKWYEKGYITKDFASLTDTEVFAMFDVGTLGMYIGSYETAAIRAADLNIEVSHCRYMRKEKDSKVRTEITNYPVSETLPVVTVVTSACKDVAAAVKALNFNYTKEGALAFTFGMEGDHWNYDETTGIPTFTEFMTKNPDGMTIGHVSYIYKCHIRSGYVFPDNIGIPSTSNTGKGRGKWVGDNDPNVSSELRLPPIRMLPEDSEERNEIMTEVDSYGTEMLLKYVTGVESMDSFDSFVNEVMDMGLDRALEITQKAYDEFVK